MSVENILTAVEVMHGHCVEKHPEYVGSLPGAVSVLTEEVGEAAQAINDYCTHGNGQDKAKAVEELLQVAASAVRLIENIDSLVAVL